MANNKVTVYVGGRRFVLVSPESEDYIKKIAKRVNDRIGEVAKNYTQLDARGCAIMAALDIADDEQKALGKKADLVHQADRVLKQADKQSKQIIELKRQYSELDKKHDGLLEQYEDLKKKNSNLTAQYNELKKFLDRQMSLNNEKKEATPEEKKPESKPSQPKAAESGEKKAPENPRKMPVNSGKKPFAGSGQGNKKIDESLIKPESAAEALHKGYMPLRQYSLFDDENK